MDLTRSMPSRLLAILNNKFDIVTTACCNFDVFIREGPRGGIVVRAWTNVIKALKPGGFIIFLTAVSGIENLERFLFGQKGMNSEKKVLTALASHIESSNLRLQSVPLTANGAFGRWYSSFMKRNVSHNDPAGHQVSLADLRRDNFLIFQKTHAKQNSPKYDI